MEIKVIQNIRCHYHVSGTGKDLILLHGWGQNIEMMLPLQTQLAEDYRVWSLDLPGSGASDAPAVPFDVTDYARFLNAFVTELKINKPILIGHSFGGRVAIVYADLYPTAQLVLMDAAGILPKRGFWYYFRVYTYKATKLFLNIPLFSYTKKQLESKAGSSDYRALSPLMKQTFIKIVNQDLTPLLPKITQPTLLIWGAKDQDTPLWMGEKMAALIKHAELVVYQDAGHYAYLEKLNEVIIVIKYFLNDRGGK